MALEEKIIKIDELKSINQIHEGMFLKDENGEKYVRKVEENAFMTYFPEENKTRVDIYQFDKEELKIVYSEVFFYNYNTLIGG